MAKHKLADNDLSKGENMKQEDIQEIVKNYYDQINPEHRYTSFDYCYNYFHNKTSDLTKDMEKSCLQLGFYLASWGMLRNSDLLQKSSKYYQRLIEYISSLNKDDREIDVDKYNDKNILRRLSAIYFNIESILNGTVTLTTKVMLGVFGSIPAFDDNFCNAFRNENCGFRRLNDKSLSVIKTFYDDNKQIINNLSESIFTIDFETGQRTEINYPKAKIIDMYGFTKGLLMEKEKNKNGEINP